MRSIATKNTKKSKIQSTPIGLKFGRGMFLTMPDTMVMLILRENDVIKTLMTSSSKGSPLKKIKNFKCSNQFFFNFIFIRDLIYSTHLLTLSMTPAYTAPAKKYAESAHFLIDLIWIA